jgi:hypothetical protein
LIKAQPKVFTLEDDDEDDDGNMDEDYVIPPSFPNISESSTVMLSSKDGRNVGHSHLHLQLWLCLEKLM